MDSREIAKGICDDLDYDMRKLGITITEFNIESFSYPEEIKKMQEKAAAQSMVGDMNKYQQIAVADSMSKGGAGSAGRSVAGDMVGVQIGMAMGQQMVQTMMNGNQQATVNTANAGGVAPKFCPDCGTPTNGANFCGNCGKKLV